MSRVELEHFHIGTSYGGNQEWFRTFMMRIGGCGAETACDSSLYFALHKGIEGIYPFDKDALNHHDYVEFAHMMEHYLWPRWSGIDRLDIFIDGYSKYLEDRGVKGLSMSAFSGNAAYEEASETLKKQINAGYPVPTLVLNHKNRKLKDYVWHWFLINGYREQDEDLYVKAVTYSSFEWLSLKALWDTGYENKGGFVIYKIGP